MTTTAVDTGTVYVFTVTDGEHAFEYQWGKEPPEGQSLQDYLHSCKREAELLAADAIARMAEPTPIQL